MSIPASRSRAPSQWVCKSCAVTLRTFSTTIARPAIAPESPRYIDVPQPPQRFVKGKTIVKGKLPVPKNVFGGEKGTSQVSPTWFDKTTPEPSDRTITDPQHQDRLLWKQRMADRRRQNLREGMLELHKRQKHDKHRAAVRHEIQISDFRRRVTAPEREDERLTRPSVNAVLRDIFKPSSGHVWTGKPLSERRANYAAHASAKAEARKDALHTLYMHARHFITTEQGLEEAVEKAFTDENGNPITKSMWDGDDARRPSSTDEMLARDSMTVDRRTRERMKRIAEELTGGTIGEEWQRPGLS